MQRAFRIRRSITDHPALSVQVTYPVRIHAAARAIERLFPVAADDVFAATDPARVTIPIEPASISHKNDRAGKISFARERHRGRGSDGRTEGNNNQDGRNDFVHSFFPLRDLIPRPRRCLRAAFRVPRIHFLRRNDRPI